MFKFFFHVKLEESESGLIFLQTKIRLDNWTTKSLPSKWGCKWLENAWDCWKTRRKYLPGLSCELVIQLLPMIQTDSSQELDFLPAGTLDFNLTWNPEFNILIPGPLILSGNKDNSLGD